MNSSAVILPVFECICAYFRMTDCCAGIACVAVLNFVTRVVKDLLIRVRIDFIFAFKSE